MQICQFVAREVFIHSQYQLTLFEFNLLRIARDQFQTVIPTKESKTFARNILFGFYRLVFSILTQFLLNPR